MSIEEIGGIAPSVVLEPIREEIVDAGFLKSLLKTACLDQHFTTESTPINTPYPKMATTTVPSQKTPEITINPPSMSMAKNPSVDEFVTALWPYAKIAATAIGLDPKLLIAQAALETGWGKFITKKTDGISSHNVFNIKSNPNHADHAVSIKTTEYIANTPVNLMASFKTYSSIADSFNDYVTLIQGVRYASAIANAPNPKRYVEALHEAGYATDPNYAPKILAIYEGVELDNAFERLGLLY